MALSELTVVCGKCDGDTFAIRHGRPVSGFFVPWEGAGMVAHPPPVGNVMGTTAHETQLSENIKVLVVAENRLLREALARVLRKDNGIRVV